MKVLLLVLVSLTLFSCDDKYGVITTDNNDDFASVLGKYEDEFVDIRYKSTTDTVTIESKDTNEGSGLMPITFMGIRFNSLDYDSADKVCSILGFTDLPNSQLISTVSESFREAHNNDFGIKTSYFPVYHFDFDINTMLGSFFDFKPVVSSYYFLQSNSNFHDEVPKPEQEQYIGSIKCKGTTSIHFDGKGNFLKEGFIKSIFEKQYAEKLTNGTNGYTLGLKFLLLEAKDAWEHTDLFNNRMAPDVSMDFSSTTVAEINKDNNFLYIAQEAATDICKKSNYSGLLFYTLDYILASNLNNNQVYRYDARNEFWIEGSAPKKYDFSNANHAHDKNHHHQLPDIYIDSVFCF